MWFKERRKQLGWTQAELASCAGCTAATICKIEGEERRPSWQVPELLAICRHIPVKQHFLFLQITCGERHVDRLAGDSPAPNTALTRGVGSSADVPQDNRRRPQYPVIMP